MATSVGTSHVLFGESGKSLSLAGQVSNQAGAFGTPASTVETVLASYTLTRNTLNTAGKALRVVVWYTTAANANTKRIRIRIGTTGLTGTVVLDTTALASNAAAGCLFADITRTGAATGDAFSGGQVGSAVPLGITYTAITPTWSADQVIAVTGQNGTAAANDAVVRLFVVDAVTDGAPE